MNETTNYGLVKPSEGEFYDIEDFNSNSDIIDSELATNKASIEATNAKISTLEASMSGSGAVDSKIGEATDAETVASVFGRIRQVYNYLTGTILTKLNGIISTQSSHTTTLSTINTNVNTANTSLTAIKGYTDGIETTQASHTTLLNSISNNTAPSTSVTYIASPSDVGRTDISLTSTSSINVVANSYNGGSTGGMVLIGMFIPKYSGCINIVGSTTYTVNSGGGYSQMSIYEDSLGSVGDYSGHGVTAVGQAGSGSSIRYDKGASTSGVGTYTNTHDMPFIYVTAGKRYSIVAYINTGYTSNGANVTLKTSTATISFANATNYIKK